MRSQDLIEHLPEVPLVKENVNSGLPRDAYEYMPKKFSVVPKK